jgi:hypothetical protein
MANTRKVVVEVTDNGTLKQVAGEARKLNDVLDRTAQPRKVQSRAASAALSASGGGISGGGVPPITEGLGRGTAAGFGRGDTRDFGRQAQGLGGLVHLYATFAANIYAVTAAFNAMSKAADFTNMQKAADILSLKVGISINGLAKDMQKATDGAISMSEALSNASLATSAGLNTKQIKELTSVAKGASIALGRDLTDAMTRVFRGTIKIEPELLDELGLMVKVDDANKAYAKTLNKTVSSLTDYERRQAFVNAVTEQGIRKYKELADQTANPFSKLAASLKDISTDVLTTINSILGPLVNVLSQSPTALLLGMTAIVGLLLKQAIPAIGDMQSAWEASDRAAQESLSKQRKALEDQKSAVLALNEAKVKAAQQKFVETRDTAIQGLESSGIKKSKLKGIDDAAKLGNFIGLSEEQIKAQTAVVQKELEKARGKIQTEIAKTQDILDRQGKKSGKTFLNAQAEIGRLNSQLAAINNFENQGLQAISGAATAQALVQKNLMTTDTEITNLTQKIGKFEQMGQRLAVIRGAVQATEAGGFRLGFADLFDSIKKGTGQFDEFGNVVEGTGRKFSTLEKINMGLKGSFQVLTVGVSRLLGTFSIWAAVFTVLIPLVGILTDKLGLTNDKLSKLNDTTKNLTDSTKLYNDIQDKLANKSSSLSETFELNASSAKSYADMLELIAERSKKLQEFTGQTGVSGSIDKGIESLKAVFFNSGEFGRDANIGIAKEFDKLMSSDKQFAKTNKGILPEGRSAESIIDSLALEDLSGRIPLIEKLMQSVTNPAQVKSAKEFSEASVAMKNNLKDLDTISSEYIITLQDQSKHLKALNGISASTSNLFKQLSSQRGGMANIGEYLKGITGQFQEMSKVNLSPKLQNLKDILESNEKSINVEFDKDISNAKGRPELIALAEFNRANSTNKSADQAAIKAGYKDLKDATIDLTKYSIDVSKSLANLASASASAAIEQANLSRDLKKNQFLFSLSGASTKGLELDAEKRKVQIENSARQSNIDSLKAQRELQIKMLQPMLGTSSTSSKELGQLASNKLLDRATTNEDRSSIYSAMSGLLGTDSAITIARADISVANSSLTTPVESRIIKFEDNLDTIQSQISQLQGADTVRALATVDSEFKDRVSIGSEEVDSQYAYKIALINSNAELATATVALGNFKSKLNNLKVEEARATGSDKAALSSAVKIREEQLLSLQAKVTATEKEDEVIKAKFYAENELRLLKEVNTLQLADLELKKRSGIISDEDLNILKLTNDYKEKVYLLEERAFLTQDASLLKAIEYEKAVTKGKVALEESTKELRIQSETLERIDSLFGSNKASTGLLNVDQVSTINQAYTEILAKQQQISQNKIDKELTGNEKLIAQEALRVEYLEKALELQEKTLIAREKLTQPYEINDSLLAERFELNAKKFRDTLKSYNETIVDASYAAVDTFVDGIGNAVKTLDFDLKSIIRDTIFAFDDMMLEYAGNQLKAMMKDAISQYFKIDISTEKEKADKANLENTKTAAEKLTSIDGLTLKMESHLASLAGKTSTGATKAESPYSLIKPLDMFGSSQTAMLKSQEAGLSAEDMDGWKGSVDELAKTETKSVSILGAVSSTLSEFATSFKGGIQSILSTLGTMISTMFSSSSSSSSSGIGGLVNGLGSLFSMGGGTTSASMFAGQESNLLSMGFSTADLARWGGSMTGFATGGAFNVGGQGGTDSKLVQFMATPGEQVIVKTPEQQKESGGATTVHVVNHFTINGPTSRESQQQISAKVGASIQRAMARNN